MHDKAVYACSVIGVIGSAIANALGGWDYAVQTLLLFMGVDFVLGLACAIFWGKSDKSENGGLSSKACWRGIVKKCGTLLIVVCGTYADKMLGFDYIRNTVVIGFCVAELISICETAGIMGIMPKQVKAIFDRVLDIMKGKDKDDE